MKTFAVLLLGLVAAGCSRATYKIIDSKTGQELQAVDADAPGGDAFVMVVYYGAQKTPIVHAGGDSTALVNATAAAGRKAVELALKAAKP